MFFLTKRHHCNLINYIIHVPVTESKRLLDRQRLMSNEVPWQCANNVEDLMHAIFWPCVHVLHEPATIQPCPSKQPVKEIYKDKMTILYWMTSLNFKIKVVVKFAKNKTLCSMVRMVLFCLLFSILNFVVSSLFYSIFLPHYSVLVPFFPSLSANPIIRWPSSFLMSKNRFYVCDLA